MWPQLQDSCRGIVLTDENHKCRWILNKSGNFSVYSLYVMLKMAQVKCPLRKFWYINVPLKIRVFVWLLFKNSIVTKENLLKRGWTGSGKCMFYSEVEL